MDSGAAKKEQKPIRVGPKDVEVAKTKRAESPPGKVALGATKRICESPVADALK
jgi:hypothetical protein